MSCVFNDPECNAKGEAGVPHPSKPGAIVYGLCTCPGVSYRYGICDGIPEAYLPSFDEFYRNMTGESLTLDLSKPVITLDQPSDVLTDEETLNIALSQAMNSPEAIPCKVDPWAATLGLVEEEPEVLVKRLQFIKLGIAIDSMNEALKELKGLRDSVTEEE